MKETIKNPVIKDTVTFVQTSESTQGKVTEMDITLFPGGKSPKHYHTSFTETFTALDGDLELKFKKGFKILKPGESLTIQKKEIHAFHNPNNESIKFKVELHPAHQGFEYSLRILYGLASDGLTNKSSIPKKFQHTAIIACMGEQNLPGLLTILSPILKRIARKAKESGEEQNLIDKYCV